VYCLRRYCVSRVSLNLRLNLGHRRDLGGLAAGCIEAGSWKRHVKVVLTWRKEAMIQLNPREKFWYA
jgi:hypothetical protein